MIEFTPSSPRYTPKAVNLLLRISTALGTIRGARVLPAVADQLRASAKAGTVHFSNLIEGNELPLVEAERATRGELDPSSRAKIELVNYVEAMNLIYRRVDQGTLELTPQFLKEINQITMSGLGRLDDPHFKPHHEGEWRDGIAIVYDPIANRITHEGPPSEEVPTRMEAMFNWLTRQLTTDIETPFVLAGVMHYGIADIHPFADGNGRAARLFQTALLLKTNLLPGRMLSFDRYYAQDRSAYYAALSSVREKTLNMETWLEYFLLGLAEEYERVATTVSDLSSLVASGSKTQLRLTSGQERALATLRLQGRLEFSRRDYEEAAHVKRSTAGDDLRDLVRHGILATRGATSSTRYQFSVSTANSTQTSHQKGRPTKWNDAIIERELRAYLKDVGHWPTPNEFRKAGKGRLYAAASKAGGISRWRRLMGL